MPQRSGSFDLEVYRKGEFRQAALRIKKKEVGECRTIVLNCCRPNVAALKTAPQSSAPTGIPPASPKANNGLVPKVRNMLGVLTDSVPPIVLLHHVLLRRARKCD